MPNRCRLASTSEVFGQMEKRLSVSFRAHLRRRPAAMPIPLVTRPYDFGDVRVATLALPTALSG
jgi:hypothetical protein